MKFFRVKSGLSQKEAASKLGINYYQLCNYEINRSEPNLDTLVKMADLYGVSIDYLLKGESDQRLAKTKLIENIKNNEKLLDEILNLIQKF